MRGGWVVVLLAWRLVADSVNSWTPLHEAVFANDWNRTKRLIAREDTDIDAQSKAGITPLMVAVKTRNLAMVRYLLEHGADVDLADHHGHSPLLYAVAQHRLGIVRLLVRYDADVNQPNRAGITPLAQAAYGNDLPIVEFLLDHGADADALDRRGINACELAYLKGNFAMAHYLKPMTRGVCGVYWNDFNTTKRSEP